MFRKFISLGLLALFFQCNFAFAEPQQVKSIACPPQLTKIVSKIQMIPEARKLINDAQKEGSISITFNSHHLSQQFGAFWDVDNRTICVSPSSQVSEGEMIGSILFELHNALVNSKIMHLDRLATLGQISKEKYVESIEFLEYENSIKAAKIADKGISMGIFPRSARLFTYASFEEHYRMQKIGGHSAWIARTYDQLKAEGNGFYY